MVVGLTGGIGSGKSTVARLLQMLGCAVFHSDQAARDIYFDPVVKPQIEALLGKESYLSGGQINKAYISARIFGNKNTLQALNAILHPAVGIRFSHFAAANAGKIIVKESALLIEAGLQGQADRLVVVAAPDELRIARVMQRDGLSREEVQKKLDSQMKQEEKIKLADAVLHNDEKQLLIPQVLSLFNSFITQQNYA